MLTRAVKCDKIQAYRGQTKGCDKRMDRSVIAKTLTDLRGEKKREEVALAVGVTAQAIANYETGVRIPSDDIKVRLARFYGVPVQDIFFAD